MDVIKGFIAAAISLFILVVLVGGCLYGCPKYNVWEQSLSGEAELKRAQYTRQIAIQEASAKKESSKLLAEADTIRARGVAGANHIIGQSLHDNEAYLRYLWIQNLHEGKNQVIYVPTEANLPILEAGKR